MEVKLERRPIPADRRIRYPWEKMKVGDSFARPGAPGSSYSLVKEANKRFGSKKFQAIYRDGKMRIWRIK